MNAAAPGRMTAAQQVARTRAKFKRTLESNEWRTGTQLDPYRQREQEHEIQFQSDSDGEEATTGTTRSGKQYTLAGNDETGEIFLVGATGHNYGNTSELNVMTYKEAMASVDKEQWDTAVKEEHDK